MTRNRNAIQPILLKALQSQKLGHLEEAGRLYESVLKLDHRNFDALQLLGLCCYQGGRVELALKHLDAALAIRRDVASVFNNRGIVLRSLRRYPEALSDFNSALALDAKFADAYLNKGNVQVATGDHYRAIGSFESAVKLNPRNIGYLNNYASCLSELGRISEAIDCYEKIIRLDGKFHLAHLNRGLLLQKRGDYDHALSAYQKAIENSPSSAEAHSGYGDCLREIGRLDEALASCRHAVNLNAQSAQSHCSLGSVLKALNQPDDALKSYERAITLKPGYAEAHNNRGIVLKELSRFGEALASYDKAINLKPNYAEAYSNRGVVLAELKRFEEALASYDKAIDLKVEYAEAYNNRGNVLTGIGRFDEALGSYDKAISLKPDYAEAHGNRGVVLAELNRLEEALASYDKAIELKADYAEAFNNRGNVLAELNRPDEALRNVGQYLQVNTLGSSQVETLIAHWVELHSVDKIPAIYSSEAELFLTRQRIEETLDKLVSIYSDHPPLAGNAAEVARYGVLNLAGFYLSYHQQNDRETARKFSFVCSKLLASHPVELKTGSRRGERIRVGIASGRLRNHNGANWAYNWFRYLPSDDYELFTYNFDNTRDQLAEKFSKLGTHRQLSWTAASQQAVLQQMRDDGLDVLMLPDVGMNSVSRFLSLHRIAKRQFTAWGHPVTTGSPEMDFYLSSDLMEPENAQDHYTEKLVRLPNLGLFLEEDQSAAQAVGAEYFGLPEGRVLYGCLQSLFKYLPRYDCILPRVALEVPSALFVFIEGRPSYMTGIMMNRLEKAFEAEGLDARRHVTFLPRQSAENFDRLLQAINIGVDSVGWTGGNTSLKHISSGIPLATMKGELMRGRHTAAMFRLIGADEMTSCSIDDYVGTLVRLGKEAEFRHHCKELFLKNRNKLYRDHALTRAFDEFLKEEK